MGKTPWLPTLTVKDIRAFQVGDRVTIQHDRGQLLGLSYGCTDRGTVHSIRSSPYRTYKNEIEHLWIIVIRKYRCRNCGWRFVAGPHTGDRVRILQGWEKVA